MSMKAEALEVFAEYTDEVVRELHKLKDESTSASLTLGTMFSRSNSIEGNVGNH